MLDKDRRNFHAWSYRRYLVARLESDALLGKSLAEDEFAYTRQMIEKDLSNFSAWHNRSRLMLRLLAERNADDRTRAAFLEAEFSFIQNALNVGPEDQSLWYYHRFLVAQVLDLDKKPSITPNLSVEDKISYLEQEIEFIKDLIEDFAGIKWPYEALLEYTSALCQQKAGAGAGGGGNDPDFWLDKLRKSDPMQTGRWDDVKLQLQAA